MEHCEFLIQFQKSIKLSSFFPLSDPLHTKILLATEREKSGKIKIQLITLGHHIQKILSFYKEILFYYYKMDHTIIQ